MSNFPRPLLGDGVNTGTSARATASLTGGAANTLSAAFTELDPSVAANAGGLYVQLTATVASTNLNTSALLSIYTGAAAAETLWATIGVGYMMSGAEFYIPGFIAGGTRISAKCQGAQASETVDFAYAFLDMGPEDIGPPVTMGAVTGSSRGTTLTAPGGVNTKAAWTELEDSTTDDICALLVCVAEAGDSTFGNGAMIVDIGVGAAAAETVLIGDVGVITNSSEQLVVTTPLTYTVDVPAGSRLSARFARSTGADSCDVLLVGATVA